jgi:UDP-3-O-acyl-N-acetylglucosamine deacetylase
MTDQEILNRIDAKHEQVEALTRSIELDSAQSIIRANHLLGFLYGLKFARALIQKRTEEVSF